MRNKGHCVIVVAEGCGDTLIASSGERDAGGNKILADVGPWLKDTITARFKSLKLPLTIKYIDPTYMRLGAEVLEVSDGFLKDGHETRDLHGLKGLKSYSKSLMFSNDFRARIRSVAANSYDSTYCSVLGQMAVHGAMAGYSGITVPGGPLRAPSSGQVGQIYSRRSDLEPLLASLELLGYCYLPIHLITNQKGKRQSLRVGASVWLT